MLSPNRIIAGLIVGHLKFVLGGILIDGRVLYYREKHTAGLYVRLPSPGRCHCGYQFAVGTCGSHEQAPVFGLPDILHVSTFINHDLMYS
jgi:hypothetical protein